MSDSGAAPLNYPADKCVEGFTSYVAICEKPTAVIASLGDGDDITNGDASAPFTVDAGPGKDVIRADINATYSAHLSGGAGDDKITGGMGADVIDGGDGDDELSGRDAADTITGGNGNDKLLGDGYNIDAAADTLDGGPGTDSIESEWTKDLDHKDPINVTLAGGADDGRAGEGDNLISIESVTTNLPGTYTGSEGADTVDVNQVEVPSTIKRPRRRRPPRDQRRQRRDRRRRGQRLARRRVRRRPHHRRPRPRHDLRRHAGRRVLVRRLLQAPVRQRPDRRP